MSLCHYLMQEDIIKSERIVYSEICPICKKKIKGFSESHLKYNVDRHKEAHKREATK